MTSRQRNHPPTRLGAAVLAGLLLMGSAACGDDESDGASSGVSTTEDSSSSETTEAPSSETTEAAETTAAEGEGGGVAITAIDYAYEGVPDTIAPGDVITLTNDSEVEIHEIVAVPIGADETRPIEEIAEDPAAVGALFGGGPPSAVILASPGSDMPGPVVGDGTLSEPGRYALVCSIPTGADPQAYLDAAGASEGGPPDVPGGPPHFTQGMIAEVTVEE